MSRLLSTVPATQILLCCGALIAQVQQQGKAMEEAALATPVLQQAEIVEVVRATWEEIAEGCQTEQPVESPESPGRLMTLRAGDHTYRIFLSEGKVIHCMDTEEGDEQPAVQIDQNLQEIAEIARNDLAERLAVEPSEIELLRAERVTWRDSSGGCPEPGKMYMQVLTEGARILLAFSGTEYSYHQASGAPPFLCENPSKLEPLPGPEIR